VTLRLAKLELIGFKSFMGKSVLTFEDGISAILGPNGCGKSNVVDAVRWVLGEQSAKLLRGVKMENVIFDGTKKRPAMGFAEVSLTFTGASERLPVDWDEISIKRRVNRGGGSEYFLNNQPYRLHEIRDLLAGTGLGNHAYSIIEQDMVKDVISTTGDKRRLLFEEASGIMKYKLRRKESLSKLKSTEGDLTRLNDIIEELGKTVRSLKYQVGRAKSYQRLEEELRQAEIFQGTTQLHDLHLRDLDLQKQLTGLVDQATFDETRVAELEGEISRRQAEMAGSEADYQGEREILDRETETYRKREETLAVLDERIRSGRSSIATMEQEARLADQALQDLAGEVDELAVERVDLEGRREELAGELKLADQDHRDIDSRYRERRSVLKSEKQLQLDFARNLADAGDELSRLRERLSQGIKRSAALVIEKQDLSTRQVEIVGTLTVIRQDETDAGGSLARCEQQRLVALSRGEELRRELKVLEDQFQESRIKVEQISTRIGILKKLQEQKAGYPDGTVRLLKEKAGQGSLRGALAELIRVPPKHRLAVETALAQMINAVVVDDHRQGVAWLQEMQNSAEGRGMILALSGRSGGEVPSTDLTGLRHLTDLIEADDDLKLVLKKMLAHHYLAPDVESAVAAIDQHPDLPLQVVTPDGFLFTGSLMAGGQVSSGEGEPLGRNEEIQDLAKQLTDLDPELRTIQQKMDSVQTDLTELGEQVQEFEEEIREDRLNLTNLGTECARQETRLTRIEEELQGIIDETGSLDRQMESLRGDITSAELNLGQFDQGQPDEDVDLGALEDEVTSLEREREQTHALLSEKKMESTSARGRMENIALREENLQNSTAGQYSRREKNRQSAALGLEELADNQTRSSELREELTAMQGDLQTRRDAVAAQQTDIVSEREALGELQSHGRALREEQREQEQSHHQIEMERNTISVKMEELTRHFTETWELELDPTRDPVEQEGWRPAEGKTVDEALENIRIKIKRIGVVNLLALEEYEEKNKRFEFLSTQKDDLVKARDGLLETIDQINRKARQMFTESFKVIRENFIGIFATLFEGGEADLSYTTDDDPLQADIVIKARPRDKKISTIQQLSSGEKTLTALSLLFAVYLSKPSPFCIFDEVDAPLDDANIARFLRLVREFSSRTQFILITHNKKTMEVAKHLYGVTMEENGISKVVSVAFEDVPDDLDDADALTRSAS
jgi:chromosome segregation protein